MPNVNNVTLNDLNNDNTISGKESAVVQQVNGKQSILDKLNSKFPKWREAMFLTSVGGMAFMFGFGGAISSAKKKDTDAFDKGVTPNLKSESGVALASRALRWGTFYAVTGCGIIFFCVWKMMGVKNLQEFRQKSGAILPKISKNDPPQGRTEFKSLTDLLQYISDEDDKAKSGGISDIIKNTNISQQHSSSSNTSGGNKT